MNLCPGRLLRWTDGWKQKVGTGRWILSTPLYKAEGCFQRRLQATSGNIFPHGACSRTHEILDTKFVHVFLFTKGINKFKDPVFIVQGMLSLSAIKTNFLILYKTKFALCSEVLKKTQKHTLWAARRINECSTWWYVKDPLGFKRLVQTFLCDKKKRTYSLSSHTLWTFQIYIHGFFNVEFHQQIEFSVMKYLYFTLLSCSTFFFYLSSFLSQNLALSLTERTSKVWAHFTIINSHFWIQIYSWSFVIWILVDISSSRHVATTQTFWSNQSLF